MPRVARGAEVTLVVLVYRSLDWLKWCMEGVNGSRQRTRYRWLVVANDATEHVRRSRLVDVDWTNEDTAGKSYPDPAVMRGIYRAWNEGVLNAPTQAVIMLNSDMLGADHWIDELMRVKQEKPRTVPTSLLIESGRIPSAMPEWVHDFGTNPETFNKAAFDREAALIQADHKSGEVEPGRLFMPILVDRQEFMDVGGYPEGNPPGTTGDKDLIRRYTAAGFAHVTALGSVVYHCQEGETRWP